jgi:hypothetical protein
MNVECCQKSLRRADYSSRGVLPTAVCLLVIAKSYSENAISITYSEYVFVDLGIQHKMRMLHIVMCGLPASTSKIFFHLIS